MWNISRKSFSVFISGMIGILLFTIFGGCNGSTGTEKDDPIPVDTVPVVKNTQPLSRTGLDCRFQHRLHAFDDGSVYALCQLEPEHLPRYNWVLKSEDGGVTWVDMEIKSMNDRPQGEQIEQTEIASIWFYDSKYGIASTEIGSNSALNLSFITLDGGKTWLQSANFYKNVDFSSDGFGVGSWGADSVFAFGKGVSDIKKLPKIIPYSSKFNETLKMFDSMNGVSLVAEDYGKDSMHFCFYKTEDGGTTWSKNTSNVYEDLSILKMRVFDKSKAVVLGRFKTPGTGAPMWSTEDGGKNWSFQNSEHEFLNEPDESVYLKYSLNGALYLQRGNHVSSSPDNGKTWKLELSASAEIRDFSVTASGKIFAIDRIGDFYVH